MLFLACEHALLFGQARMREHSRRCEQAAKLQGPRKGAPFSPPSPGCWVSPPANRARTFHDIPQMESLLAGSAVANKAVFWIWATARLTPMLSRWPNNPFTFYCPKFPDNYYCKLLLLLSLLLLRHNTLPSTFDTVSQQHFTGVKRRMSVSFKLKLFFFILHYSFPLSMIDHEACVSDIIFVRPTG